MNSSSSIIEITRSVNDLRPGWAAFYKFTDFTVRVLRHIDHVVFWKHWLAKKYRSTIKPLMRKWYRAPGTGKAKAWIVYGINERGSRVGKALRRLVPPN